MFSNFTKRLQDSLEAVEQAVVNSGGPANRTNQDGQAVNPDGSLPGLRRSSSMQRSSSPDPTGRSRSPAMGASTVRNTLDKDSTPPARRGGSLDERLRAKLNASLSSTPSAPLRETVSSPLAETSRAPVRAPSRPSTPSNRDRSSSRAKEQPPLPPPRDPIAIPLPLSPPEQSAGLPAMFSPPSRMASPVPIPVAPDSDPLTSSLHSLNTVKPTSPTKTNIAAAHTPSASLDSLVSRIASPPPPSAEAPTRTPEAPTLPENTAPPLTTTILETPIETPVPTQSKEIADSPEVATTPVEEPLNEEPTQPKEVSSPPIESESQKPTESAQTSEGDAESQQIAERLKVVEQRFSDVSGSFKRLQNERARLDTIFREHTPLQGLGDIEALQTYLAGIGAAATQTSEEIKQLTAKIKLQEDRVEELHDTHRLESRSRSEQIDRLQAERTETEALLSVAQEQAASRATEITQLREELEKSKKVAKEEEEKRVKAITLLKNVRTKAVQAEKSLEDSTKERDRLAVELQAQTDVAKSKDEEIEKIRKDALTHIAQTRAQGEGELNATRKRLEREAAGKQSSYEAETANLQSAHAEELALQAAHIARLDKSIQSLTQERNQLFDQLQVRQAEVESSQSHLESLENQVNELRHVVRESNDRAAALSEELAESQRRAMDSNRLSPRGSGRPDVAALQAVANTERKYEAKLSDLRGRMATMEKERSEAEEEWSRNLAQRSREIERLRNDLATRDGQQSAQVDKDVKAQDERSRLEAELRIIKDERQVASRELGLIKSALEQAKEAESLARLDQKQFLQKIATLEAQVDEIKSREGQLRSANKTLRDELKKVQSSAALLERQRNPGLGYWGAQEQSRSNVASNTPSRPSSPSQSVTSDGARSPGGATNGNRNSAEDVNLEYLRNLILQFLEHKEMRADLVRVMSVILRFTPAETRRLVSKV